MSDLVGHFLLFTIAGIVFLIAPLILGLFVRPKKPTAEKLTPYECGEPAIGSAYIQFDLRFYVVALLFIIFDVEIAFFFPWAMVYGNAMQLADSQLSAPARTQLTERLLDVPQGSLTEAAAISSETAFRLGLTGLFDILVFFGVLLVGFAYVWKRGDLDWVRAVSEESKQHSRTRLSGPAPAPLTNAPQMESATV